MRRSVFFVLSLGVVSSACGEPGRAGTTFGLDSLDDVGTLDEADSSSSSGGDSNPLPDIAEGGSTGDSTGGSTGTSTEGGEPNTTGGWDTGNGGPNCSEIAATQNWGAFYCDNGNGICNGQGVQSDDCFLCCSGPSCGEYADQQGWDWANCEWNNNGACNGQGTPTYDCQFCCGGSDGGSTSTTTTGGTTTTTGGNGNGFGYPVGDKSSYPAGGWQVWQVMGHWWEAYGGRHLAQDIAAPGGGVASVNAPVYSVADGVVRYAGSNGSSYKNVVLIEHDDGEGGKICSFYGHTNPPMVSKGDQVTRGQQITTVRDWAQCVNGGASSNTHLHYILVSKALCDASAAANGSLMCGYDKGPDIGISTLADEPYYFTAVGDICGDSNYQNAFISPTKFIEDHHF